MQFLKKISILFTHTLAVLFMSCESLLRWGISMVFSALSSVALYVFLVSVYVAMCYYQRSRQWGARCLHSKTRFSVPAWHLHNIAMRRATSVAVATYIVCTLAVQAFAST